MLLKTLFFSVLSLSLIACGGGGGSSTPEVEPSPVKPLDSDADGVLDINDAFPLDPKESTDSDNDGVGDNQDKFPQNSAEHADSDGDGTGDNSDAFVNDPEETADIDNDGVGDNRDKFVNNPAAAFDNDADGFPDAWSNSCNDECQSNSGLILDLFPNDKDNDGSDDSSDLFPNNPDESLDSDNDGTGDNADDFKLNSSASIDTDADGFPDSWNPACNADCQSSSGLLLDQYLNDKDNDGSIDAEDAFPTDPTEAVDADSDGTGDNSDKFPFNAAASIDVDLDGFPDSWNQTCNLQCQQSSNLELDVSLLDRDNDGSRDDVDIFPEDPNESLDTDSDGTGDNSDAFINNIAASIDGDKDDLPDFWNSTCDLQCQNNSGLTLDVLLDDSDNDGVLNSADAFPLDETESVDTDSDGTGDNSDAFTNNNAASIDEDLDGYPDQWNSSCNSDCQNTSELIIDPSLEDRDNDLTKDINDTYPDDPNESKDTDLDSFGDNADAFPTNAAANIDNDNDGRPDSWNWGCKFLCQSESGLTLDTLLDDKDNDGVKDNLDAFPSDPTETLDTDNDRIGNNTDLDDDGDSLDDYLDPAPLDDTNSLITLDTIIDGERSTSHKLVDFYSNYGVHSSSIGDIDNDGKDDVLVSTEKNSAYVIFGADKAVINAIDIRNPNVNEGIEISSLQAISSHYKSANIGDINNDTIDDLAIAGDYYQTDDGTLAGIVYIFFGKTNFTNALTAADADVVINFGLLSATTSTISISSAGDFNNDGIKDLIVGIPGQRSKGGRAYIILGKEVWPAIFDAVEILENKLDGTNGMLITGTGYIHQGSNGQNIQADGFLGQSVNSVGDINDDGFDDVIIGAPEVSRYNSNDGAAYIIFGKTTLSASLDVSEVDGSNGTFIFRGNDSLSNERFGSWTANIGDINNDGISDAAIASPKKGIYVILGKTVWNKITTNSVAITTNGTNYSYLTSLSGIHDFNGDRINDMAFSYDNKAYVLFGDTAFASTWSKESDLYQGPGKIDGVHGLKIETNHISSLSTAGDLNSDGKTDIILGDKLAHEKNAGESIILYGF